TDQCSMPSISKILEHDRAQRRWEMVVESRSALDRDFDSFRKAHADAVDALKQLSDKENCELINIPWVNAVEIIHTIFHNVYCSHFNNVRLTNYFGKQ
ncbi:hypothetical protein PFISCL1PPCAC_7352, partial [Pristionchus fissidentatus]